MSNVRIKIADTYEREVEIELPGDGLEPQKAKIIAGFYDVDPDQLTSDGEKIQQALSLLQRVIKAAIAGENDLLESMAPEVEQLSDMTAKIDRVLAYVKGLEVIGRDGNPLDDKALLDFVKKYPRTKTAILAKYNEENDSGEPAALGNLAQSVRHGLASRRRGPATEPTPTPSSAH